MSNEPELPGLLTQAKNFAKSVVRNSKHVLNGGTPYLEDEEIEIRTQICESGICPNYRPSDHRCADCGCFLVEKIPLTAEYCPLLLWPGDELKKALEDQGDDEDGKE